MAIQCILTAPAHPKTTYERGGRREVGRETKIGRKRREEGRYRGGERGERAEGRQGGRERERKKEGER